MRSGRGGWPPTAVLREGLGLIPDEVAGPRGYAMLPSADLAHHGGSNWRGGRTIGGVLDRACSIRVQDDEATVEQPVPSAKGFASAGGWCVRWARPPGRSIATILARAGLPVFATPDQAVRGFEDLVRDRQATGKRRGNCRAARCSALDPGRVTGSDGGLPKSRAVGHLAFAQDDALAVLGAYGIPTVPTRFAAESGGCRRGGRSCWAIRPMVKLRDTAAPVDRLAGQPGCLTCMMPRISWPPRDC